MLKYLYGKLPVASKLNGGREERMGRADALLFSVLRDAYQHKEMAFDACFIAFNGGFANFTPTLKERHFMVKVFPVVSKQISQLLTNW